MGIDATALITFEPARVGPKSASIEPLVGRMAGSY